MTTNMERIIKDAVVTSILDTSDRGYNMHPMHAQSLQDMLSITERISHIYMRKYTRLINMPLVNNPINWDVSTLFLSDLLFQIESVETCSAILEQFNDILLMVQIPSDGRFHNEHNIKLKSIRNQDVLRQNIHIFKQNSDDGMMVENMALGRVLADVLIDKLNCEDVRPYSNKEIEDLLEMIISQI